MQKQNGNGLSKFLILLYGVISYFIFLGTFLYAIGFVGNFLVPKSIDYGFQGGTGNAWLINILLLSLFAVQHSVMARRGFKKWWTKIVPRPIERSTFVLFSSLVLILLFIFWRPITDAVWNVQGLPGILLTALSFIGWFIVLLGTFLINHFNLFGLQQVYLNFKNREEAFPKFVKPLFYKVVRHPLMLGFIIAFWATPQMTLGHLLFAVATTGYILLAIQLEERDMVKMHGNNYVKYQQEVSQIIPLPPKKEVEVLQKNFQNR
ncbi:MAG: isoprenylcysteine carboxylmethyltransferase family protein [Ignavibacteriales bacterium]|nr:MAG: isoprenylcysteine carboxylmethyltransferase family protein [Ignavibacteriales bacterium]